MTYTISHKRKIASGNEIYIPTYFRLAPNKEHDKTCPNSIYGAISAILGKAKKADANFLVEKGANGKFRLSIKGIDEEIEEEEKKSKTNREGSTNIGNRPTTGNTILLPYLTTARALAKLYFSLEISDRAEFKKSVEVVMNNRTIRWSSFFYDDAMSLGKKSQIPKHPIAVILSPKNPPSFRNNNYEIQCYSPDNNVSPIIVPRIYTKDRKLADEIDNYSECLVIGKPYKSKNGKFVNLNIYVHNKSQYTDTLTI